MKKIIFLMLALVGIGYTVSAHHISVTITGQVTSADDGLPLPGVSITEKGTTNGVVTNAEGKYSIQVGSGSATLVFSFIGYETKEIKVGKQKSIHLKLEPDVTALEEVVVTGLGKKKEISKSQNFPMVDSDIMSSEPLFLPQPESNESYQSIEENIFLSPWKNPRSTFSIDVDAASYANMRRFINNGQMPPKDAVRIEEMINYFHYDYDGPKNKHPFAVHHELSVTPWNDKHRLVHIGIQGKRMATENLPASNLVFLIDVSGSMDSPNKLPLLKSAFKMLTNQLRPEDRVAMVVYAGAAGVVLPSMPGNEKRKMIGALNKLDAGGSTAGGAGIQLAYKIARENFVEGGNNRIILATDGDFNVGASSDQAMEDLIKEKRKEGVFLTVLGFGMGNYKDSKMETLADKGNGNYAYIDNITEARKVLVTEFGGTLFTIAKDVKIQVEFNPAHVQAYRLIGYENRKLREEDFNNDKKDAGELGSGHSVTALYEIIPTGVESEFKPLDELKYQDNDRKRPVNLADELMTVKLRYKAPDGDRSTLLEEVIKNRTMKLQETSDNFRWSAAVAGFGMLLRDSDYKSDLDYAAIVQLAKAAKGEDKEGYRSEFLKLVKSAALLAEY